MKPSIADRIARHANDNRQRDLQEHERVRRAVEHRRTQEEFLKWKIEMGFNLHLTAGQILFMLEDIRDDNVPNDPDGPWNEEFRWAVELIPEARRFYEDMAMECTEVKNNGS